VSRSIAIPLSSPVFAKPKFSRYLPRSRGMVDGPTHQVMGIRSERKSSRADSMAGSGFGSGIWARRTAFRNSCGRPVLTRRVSGLEWTTAFGIRPRVSYSSKRFASMATPMSRESSL